MRHALALATIFAVTTVSTLLAPRAARADDGAAPAPVTSADRSLTTNALIDKGLPAPDRTWTASDVEKAAGILAKLTTDELPRSGSERSGAVFRRLTSVESFEMLSDGQVPLDSRMAQMPPLLQGFNKVLMTYAAADQKTHALGTETIGLMCTLVRGTTQVLAVANEFMGTIPKDDPKRETRLAGLAKMKSGMANVVFGALTTTGERAQYAAADRAALATAIEEALPKVVPELPATVRRELPGRLRERIDDEPDASVKAPLERALAALEKSKSEGH